MSKGFNITDKINVTVADIRKEITGYSSLKELDKQLASIPDKMKEPMQLAIVGKISSSKSTLVNAILGKAEVVRTGVMEETWNVSWLKYGNPDSPIIVHYKDVNLKPESVERSQWVEWANRKREGNEQLKNAVSYIEVAFPHEILQKINIIDTPGLDSFYGADSQNTKDFLKQVKPDAVIMLFSKNINEDTLSDIRVFRQDVGSGFSPINAIGAMSKIDDFWNSDHDLDPIAESKRIIGSLMLQEVVKNTLFNIYPVSALTALSATQIKDDDLSVVYNLSKLSEDILARILKSEKRFATDYEDVPVSAEKRAYLLSVYGRYGIWLMIELMKENPQIQIADVQKRLLQKSGFDRFAEVLQNHFVQQSTAIKVYSLILRLSAEIRKTADNCSDSSKEKYTLERIIREMDNLIRHIKLQSDVIDFAKAYYEGQLDIESEEFEELRRINGEFGFSCIDRTGLDANATVEDMIDICIGRMKFWRIQHNTIGNIFPTQAAFIKQMLSLYSELWEDIVSAKHKLESSKKFLFGE